MDDKALPLQLEKLIYGQNFLTGIRVLHVIQIGPICICLCVFAIQILWL